MVTKGTFINNRYEILSRVGAGGMSDVYKASDHKLNRNVAIKILKEEYSKDSSFVSKFRAEAQSAARLVHPNIVNVYDVGEDHGMYYIVMELIEGLTLKKYIDKKGHLSSKEAVSIAIQIAYGIECAHNNQIVHRDIKPQNILISKEGKVKVTDFGIARAVSSNTLSGQAMGSVHYISPEQASGDYVDEKSDIYSLGITMFEMLTGQVPFSGDSTVSIALKHIQSRVPEIKIIDPTIPVSIDKIVLKCTQKNPDRRYPKISLLIADLKRALVEPDVDFVQMDNETDNTSTVMITDEEIDGIRRKSGITGKTGKEEDDIYAVSPRFSKVISVGGIVVGMLALIAVSVVVTLFLSGNDIQIPSTVAQEESETIDPRMTLVPNVIGLSADEAEGVLHDNNLGYVYDSEYEYSNQYPADSVVKQSENPGTIVGKNTTVKLTLSKGPEKVKVPDDIVGKKLDLAIEDLKKIGLEWEISYEYDGKEIDTIISTYPTPGTQLAKNETVKIVASRGNKDDGYRLGTIPSIVGMALGDAQGSVSNAGFDIGSVIYEDNESVEKDHIIRQMIKGGTKAPFGTAVGMVVSNGPEETTTKDPSKYVGTYTFAKEDILDDDGNPIETGKVTVMLNGKVQKIDSAFSSIENWSGDLTVMLESEVKGKNTIELLINGKTVYTDTVTLKEEE